MKVRLRFWIALAVMLILLGVTFWWTYESPQDRFVRELSIVHFSTSLIGGPPEGKVPSALAEADRIHVDLFRQYKKNSDNDHRFDLAWLLITKESEDYSADARQNVQDVPWPEVRIWRQRASDETLSDAYRSRLRKLLLASPTSEAKLWAARWHEKRGEKDEAEACLNSAMTNGQFWDALDAADLLLDSPKYREAAIEHHRQVLRDKDYFTWRAAKSLVKALNAGDELNALCDECKSSKWSDNSRRLVESLEKLAQSRVKK